MDTDYDKKTVLLPDNRCLFPLKTNRYVPLSDCNRILIIPSQFPDIPRKISEYLQTKSPSGANTRIMRGFYNILNTSNLYLRGISSLCEKAHFVMQNGLFQMAKWPISHPNMGFIALRNGPYRKTKRTFPDYDMGYIKIRYCTECPLFCMV